MQPLEQLPIPLLEWYRDNARILPWREDPTPYHVWVSEIMLQQTRVAAVLDYYTRFMAELPDVAALAEVPEQRLMKLWQGLGYYSRARNLQAAARQIMEEHGGVFPTRYEQVRALKGVGDYTAGAICSIALGQPVPAVDGNVLRVVTRINGDERDILAQSTKKAIAQQLQPIIPLHAPGKFTQAMMELGATVCLPNGVPQCQRCPARDFCVARAQDSWSRIPVKAPKRPRRVEERDVWLLYRENRVALCQRPPKGLLAGLWEFPNALHGQLPKGWEGDMPQGEFAGVARHIFTHVEWHLTAHKVYLEWDKLPQGWMWCTWQELNDIYAVPSAFDGVMDGVKEEIGHDL